MSLPSSSSLTEALLAAPGSAGNALVDTQLTLTRAAMVDLVAALGQRIADLGLSGARICLPLDSSLGALAALIAVLDSDASVALIPKPAADAPPDWPPFCDAVLIPPDAATGADSVSFLRPEQAVPPHEPGENRVYLRTSGTTGAPKWAVHSKDHLIANARACITRLGLSPDDRVMIPVPFHHMYGLGAGLLPSLLAGAAVSLVPRGNPLEVYRAQKAFEPSVMFLVPSQCRSIMALNRTAGHARLVVVAGDKLSPTEAAAFEAKQGTLVCLYGSTELGAITAGWPHDPADLRHRTAGPPMDGMELMLDAAPIPDAAEGAQAMRVRAAAGLSGYADATGTITAPAPAIWTTGDLIRLHLGDRIEVLGRADHAVNRDGLLVHMGEIEACLTRAPGVVQATVVAAGQTRRGAGLTAFCTVDPANIPTEEAIMQHCRSALPPRAVPDRIVIVDLLPMLGSGKVDRRRLTAEAERRLES